MTSSITATLTAAQVRQRNRQRRAQLSKRVKRQNNQAIVNQVKRLPSFLNAKNIAIYVDAQGEVETQTLIKFALKTKKRVFLPVLDPFNKRHMHFIRYTARSPLVKNRFKMLEPKLSLRGRMPKRCLSTVLCPLVAFDENCQRMGMGGGFYDRYFAFKNKQLGAKRPPKLVGLAYDFQKIEEIAAQPWDVAMHAIVSDKKVYLPRKN